MRPIDVRTAPIDVLVSVGWKWLLGPYATGFCWIRPELLTELRYNQTYWLSMLTADDLGREQLDLTLRADPGAARYDVFATANFFNFKPWAASVEYLLGQGVEATARHDEALVQRLIDGLDRRKFVITSPEAGPQRSTLVFVEPRERARAEDIYDACRPRRCTPRSAPARCVLPTPLQHGRRHRPRADRAASDLAAAPPSGIVPRQARARVTASPCAGT